MMNLGLIIPCRNEASVIARKLRNLRQLDWPSASRPHRVIVVDDHSEDETLRIAEQEIEALSFPESVRVEVVANEVHPGKPGAIRAGLAVLGDSVESCGLSDADVFLSPATVRVALEAFEADRQLQLACGVQRFVEILPESGVLKGKTVAGDAYDRATAWWRLAESGFGALFSVHGQFLVWRAELSLAPKLGIAADDLDLMLQVRRKHPSGSTRLLPDAVFYERKTPSGDAANAQALRRARAYVQVVRSHCLPPNQSFPRKLQWLAYRRLPLAAPGATLVCMVLLLILPASFWGSRGLAAGGLILAGLALSRTGRTWGRTMRLIWRALRLESQGTLPERWEMERA